MIETNLRIMALMEAAGLLSAAEWLAGQEDCDRPKIGALVEQAEKLVLNVRYTSEAWVVGANSLVAARGAVIWESQCYALELQINNTRILIAGMLAKLL